MSLLWNLLALVLGAGALVLGAEAIVKGGSALATRLGMSPLWVGLTIVAFGTSAPELAVSITAALGGEPDIVLGNVVGSNLLNLLLVMGLISLIHPLTFDRNSRFQDLPLGGLAAVLVMAFALGGTIGRLEGMLFLVGGVAYILYSGLREKSDEELEVSSESLPLSILILVAGLAFIIAGGQGILFGARGLALAAGVPERVIAITIVAFGTSLPELAVGLAGIRRGSAGLVVGNVLGSNLLNILLVLGATATIQPLAVNPATFYIDLPILIASTITVGIFVSRGRLGRAPSIGILLLYLLYVVKLFV